jgi:hypothetical protein
MWQLIDLGSLLASAELENAKDKIKQFNLGANSI